MWSVPEEVTGGMEAASPRRRSAAPGDALRRAAMAGRSAASGPAPLKAPAGAAPGEPGHRGAAHEGAAKGTTAAALGTALVKLLPASPAAQTVHVHASPAAHAPAASLHDTGYRTAEAAPAPGHSDAAGRPSPRADAAGRDGTAAAHAAGSDDVEAQVQGGVGAAQGRAGLFLHGLATPFACAGPPRRSLEDPARHGEGTGAAWGRAGRGRFSSCSEARSAGTPPGRTAVRPGGPGTPPGAPRRWESGTSWVLDRLWDFLVSPAEAVRHGGRERGESEGSEGLGRGGQLQRGISARFPVFLTPTGLASEVRAPAGVAPRCSESGPACPARRRCAARHGSPWSAFWPAGMLGRPASASAQPAC